MHFKNIGLPSAMRYFVTSIVERFCRVHQLLGRPIMHRAAFLDRDGVLIHTNVEAGRPIAITDNESVKIISGVEKACEILSRMGFLLVMVTNQPDVATGRTSRHFVEKTNAHLAQLLKLDAVEVCFHNDAADCQCRKPKPGMLLKAAADFDVDLSSSVIIGDRWRDIEAGRRAGSKTVLVDYGYTDRVPPPSDYVAASLFDAAQWLRVSMRAR